MAMRIGLLLAAAPICFLCAAGSVQYTRDSLNRLTSVAYSDGTTILYSYDSGGNRLSQVISNPSIPLPKVSVDKSTLTFSGAAGQVASAQTVTVTNGGGGSLQWNAATTASWLSVTPGSGTNSGTVNVTASAAGMPAGTYNASVTIVASASNAPVTIPVIFTVTAAQGNPSISSGGIVSAAGSSPGIARGSVTSIFGTALADAPASATTVPLPNTLGNVQVSVNGQNAPLWYVGPGQINFQVPFEAPLQGSASVIVSRDSVPSAPTNVTLTPYAPSIFVYQRVAGVLDPIVVHAATNQIVTPTSPAVPGEYVVAYGTGIGDLTALPATGALTPESPLSKATLTPTATIGGVTAAVGFAGLTPDSVGLAQFNIQVPANVPPGPSSPLVINFNGVTSPPVQLYTVGASSGATAALSDPLTGASIDSTKWNVAISPAGVGTVTPTAQGVAMQHQVGGVVTYMGLQSIWKLAGDFDVQIDYRLSNWPAQNFHTVRISASDLPQGPLGVVGIYRNSYGAEDLQMRAIGGVVADIPASDTGGTLRLVRSGSTVSSFYWNGNQFVLLGSSPTTTADTGIIIDFATPSTDAPTGITVAFESFRINSGTVAGVSVP